jgi:hypothetical protein
MNLNIKQYSRIICAVSLFATVFILSSCDNYQYLPPVIDENITLSFATDIQPIFTANCISCHGGSLKLDLRTGKSFSSLTDGKYLSGTSAESSKLYVRMTTGSHISRSTDADKLKVLIWLKQGAKNN